jgi:hypothetical protein
LPSTFFLVWVGSARKLSMLLEALIASDTQRSALGSMMSGKRSTLNRESLGSGGLGGGRARHGQEYVVGRKCRAGQGEGSPEQSTTKAVSTHMVKAVWGVTNTPPVALLFLSS